MRLGTASLGLQPLLDSSPSKEMNKEEANVIVERKVELNPSQTHTHTNLLFFFKFSFLLICCLHLQAEMCVSLRFVACVSMFVVVPLLPSCCL